ncbi:L-lysine 2,3-aminomutase [Pseudorhodobacter antarcticus]|jgi:lysine 2,3-aminomutase|uniref:L-lysine 2,3-aminomutase n=1 Tax=Pseudorhodobacter antarcticus TaxID=1077947 RepID=A0A1H8A9B3_9RHOB|nr:lysine-2,3-aminomutase-like protein [Pseudorhodobacter antarcticus]SEM67076.1 L-lysine 2,3-aminomutase [Pseudorhodobacter antarcticus]
MALSSVADLVGDGLVDAADAPVLETVGQSFQVLLTDTMRGAIATPNDGVARQFLPSAAELITRPEEMTDPIGDAVHAPVPGLTHRYPDRVILHVTQTCAVYCRFCFRRETVGATGVLPDADLEGALGYIAATPAVREVILTGGDPFTLSPRRLGAIMARLHGVPHVDMIRLHTRVPVVAPELITDGVVAAMVGRAAVFVVIHTNHAQELTDAAGAALARLVNAGVPLLSQTVLLRGVNDSVAVLEALFRALIGLRVKPYYLHHCDLARGAGHFRTTIAAGQAIMAGLRGRLSGMAIPLYVLDIPGGFGKVPIGPGYVEAGDDAWVVADPQGRQHSYSDPD